jgi:hypothetical protein
VKLMRVGERGAESPAVLDGDAVMRDVSGLPGHPYLRPADHVELEIDGLGRARQHFVAAG